MHPLLKELERDNDPHDVMMELQSHEGDFRIQVPARVQALGPDAATDLYLATVNIALNGIRVPRPDLSVSLSTPNACSQCHADRPAQWAAETVVGWYPGGRQTTASRRIGQRR